MQTHETGSMKAEETAEAYENPEKHYEAVSELDSDDVEWIGPEVLRRRAR